MLLAPLDPPGEPALLGEVLPEPHERAVQNLRDAALGQVENPSDLPQRKALVVVEGGNYLLLLAEALYGPNQPRANLGHLRGGRRVGRRVIPDEVVQPGDRASLVLQAGFGDLTCALAYWSRNARCSVTLIPKHPTNSDSVGARPSFCTSSSLVRSIWCALMRVRRDSGSTFLSSSSMDHRILEIA